MKLDIKLLKTIFFEKFQRKPKWKLTFTNDNDEQKIYFFVVRNLKKYPNLLFFFIYINVVAIFFLSFILIELITKSLALLFFSLFN